jgi:4-hydroxy-tetrahydrodipicolinate synthase
MIRLCLKGDFKAAQKGHSALIEFTRMMFAEGSPAGVKTALKYLGVCRDVVRLPLVQVSSTLANKIEQETKLLASPVAVH